MKNKLITLLALLLLVPTLQAASTGTHDAELQILPTPNNCTLLTPTNGATYNTQTTTLQTTYTCTNIYNQTNITYQIFLNDLYIDNTTDTNYTLTNLTEQTHTWKIHAVYPNSTTVSPTGYFTIQRDFYDTSFECNDELCYTVGGTGAGLARFIQLISGPLAFLIIMFIFVGIIFIIGSSIAQRILEEGGNIWTTKK